MRIVTAVCLTLLVGCTVSSTPPPSAPAAPATRAAPVQPVSERQALARLERVVQRVEPVAERICRANTRGKDCDLSIFIDENETNVANAFQTFDRNGVPIIVFTMKLAQDAANDDELAFILGHEAAHHIRGHIAQTQTTAVAGAILAGVLAQAAGVPGSAVGPLQDLGGFVGSRSFSKQFELEADEVGTVIALRAGYDPVRGSQYFARAADPGNLFLGTHPPNAQRMQIVRQTAARY